MASIKSVKILSKEELAIEHLLKALLHKARALNGKIDEANLVQMKKAKGEFSDTPELDVELTETDIVNRIKFRILHQLLANTTPGAKFGIRVEISTARVYIDFDPVEYMGRQIDGTIKLGILRQNSDGSTYDTNSYYELNVGDEANAFETVGITEHKGISPFFTVQFFRIDLDVFGKEFSAGFNELTNIKPKSGILIGVSKNRIAI